MVLAINLKFMLYTFFYCNSYSKLVFRFHICVNADNSFKLFIYSFGNIILNKT